MALLYWGTKALKVKLYKSMNDCFEWNYWQFTYKEGTEKLVSYMDKWVEYLIVFWTVIYVSILVTNMGNQVDNVYDLLWICNPIRGHPMIVHNIKIMKIK